MDEQDSSSKGKWETPFQVEGRDTNQVTGKGGKRSRGSRECVRGTLGEKDKNGRVLFFMAIFIFIFAIPQVNHLAMLGKVLFSQKHLSKQKYFYFP